MTSWSSQVYRRFAMMADLVRLWALLLLLVPLSADAYSRGAGSCHTASGGHGEATPGDGGFALSLASAPTAGSSTLALRLAHTATETHYKGFLVKVNGPGGDYDGGGASFTGLDAHALAQSKECYGPAAATHRSSDPKDAVELELALPSDSSELIATVIVMISRQSRMDSEWYTWRVPISELAVAEPPPPPGSGQQGSDGGDVTEAPGRPRGARCGYGAFCATAAAAECPTCLAHLDCVPRAGVTCPAEDSGSSPCFGICADPQPQPAPQHVDPVPPRSQDASIDPSDSDRGALAADSDSASGVRSATAEETFLVRLTACAAALALHCWT
jgi:hypothetical protein